MGDGFRGRCTNWERNAGPRNVTVIVESHGDFADSSRLEDIPARADSPHVGLLGDAHHRFVEGKEDPEFTVRKVGKLIRRTHLKGSVPCAIPAGVSASERL